MNESNAVAACQMYAEKIKDLELELDSVKQELRNALKNRETMLVALVSIEHDNWCEQFSNKIPFGKICPTCISRSALTEVEEKIDPNKH